MQSGIPRKLNWKWESPCVNRQDKQALLALFLPQASAVGRHAAFVQCRFSFADIEFLTLDAVSPKPFVLWTREFESHTLRHKPLKKPVFSRVFCFFCPSLMKGVLKISKTKCENKRKYAAIFRLTFLEIYAPKALRHKAF